MTADDETVARIRDALGRADRVEAERISVERGDDEVVLRGAVASPEEATAAALLAEQEASAVRSELRVDVNLRENAAEADLTPESASRGAAAAPATSAAVTGSGQRPKPGGTPAPTDPDSDLPSDPEAALGENLAWDPPDEPMGAPTQGEQRGSLDREVNEPLPADAGPVEEPDEITGAGPEGERPSADDLSAAELARSARRRDEREDS